MRALRIRSDLDPLRLAADLKAAGIDWLGHHRDPSLGWDTLLLRSIDGDPSNNLYHRDAARFADTPAFARCPYVREVVDELGCPTKRVRFLRLLPGTRVPSHIDRSETLLGGQLRLHAPVLTHPDVELHVGGRRLHMEPGELWYLNTLHRHRLFNPTDTTRVHLVIDCVVNERLRETILSRATRSERFTEELLYRLRWVQIATSRS